MSPKSDTIQSIINAGKIMDFINAKGQAGVREISKNLDIPKSTVFRILKSLEEIDYLLSTSDDEYAIGYKIHSLKPSLNKDTLLIKYSKYILKDFADLIGESINLAVNQKNKAYNIVCVDGEYYTLQANMPPESDLYCSSTGKIFLAYMDEASLKKYFNDELEKRTINTITRLDDFLKEKEEILKNDLSYDNEEYEYGLSCIATPIKKDGEVIAAMSISGPTTRLKFKNYDKLKEKLLEAKKKIEENIIY